MSKLFITNNDKREQMETEVTSKYPSLHTHAAPPDKVLKEFVAHDKQEDGAPELQVAQE